MLSDVDLKKLKQALAEFGSLEKAIQELRTQKLGLEKEAADSSATRAKLRKEVSSLESSKAVLLAGLEDLKGKIENRRWEYRLFTGFMALVTAQSPQDIARFAATVQEWVGVKIADPVSVRGRILQQLMGGLLKFFRCRNSSCGAQFMVNRKSQLLGDRYRCPACSSVLDAEADDSLMGLFLSPDQIHEVQGIEKLRAEVERLKPLEVFLDIPCAVCGKPLPNVWKRDEVEEIFKSRPRAHPQCWRTPVGQMLLLETFLKLRGPKGHGLLS